MTDPALPRTASAALARRDRVITWGLLGLTVALFVAFSAAFLPRLTNANFGDIEFTGWSGPMGSRLLRGDRPYVDFVLPIPPGSFVLLALLQKLQGRPLLLQELGLNAALQLGMSLLAYFMARTVTSRKNAVLTMVATLATLIQLNKECAYDHTAQIVAWASIACGLRALLAEGEHRRLRYWALAGGFAGFTLAFKQSTAVGCVGGWLIAFAYLALVDWRAGGKARLRAWLGPLASYVRGVGVGLAGVWLLLVLLGSTARAFFQAVFVDASILKGGPKLLLENLAVFLFEYPAFPASLLFIVLFVLIGMRVLAKHDALSIGDEPERSSPFRTWEAIGIALTVLVGFGAGALCLIEIGHPYPPQWVVEIDRLKELPSLGLVSAAAVFVAHLVPSTGVGAKPSANFLRTGHAINATLLAALACTLLHNTSAPEFRPFYDNDAIIPLAFMTLFVVLDRADLRWLSIGLLVFFVGSVGGNKYFRAMTATIPAASDQEWAGMRVNDHALQTVRAAKRVRALTKPTDTVLVLPEDLQIAALIGRPRPPLIGAVVFVDQYAPRLAKDDISRLDEHPPKVIVIHPRKASAWQRFFRIWSGKSGAERVIRHVLQDMIPKLYVRDSSYPTTFLWQPGVLDIYVRRDGPRAAGDTTRPETDDGDEMEPAADGDE